MITHAITAEDREARTMTDTTAFTPGPWAIDRDALALARGTEAGEGAGR